MPAGAAECLAPFAVPDTWGESDPTEDTNGDKVWDTGEKWTYGDDAGDYYTQFSGADPPILTETGYGSSYRNGNGTGIVNDFGLPMILKVQDPNNTPVSGFFYPFCIGTYTGANDYRNAIQKLRQPGGAAQRAGPPGDG